MHKMPHHRKQSQTFTGLATDFLVVFVVSHLLLLEKGSKVWCLGIFWKMPQKEKIPKIARCRIFFHGTKKMVKANGCCALEDPMHWVMGKLAAWLQSIHGNQFLVQKKCFAACGLLPQFKICLGACFFLLRKVAYDWGTSWSLARSNWLFLVMLECILASVVPEALPFLHKKKTWILHLLWSPILASGQHHQPGSFQNQNET